MPENAGAAVIGDNTDEGMLREAADLLRVGVDRWRNSTFAWVADDLLERIDARYPGSKDVIPSVRCQWCEYETTSVIAMGSHVADNHPELLTEVVQPYVLPAIDDSDIEEGSEFDGPNCI